MCTPLYNCPTLSEITSLPAMRLAAMGGNQQAQELRLTGVHFSHKSRLPLHVLVRRGA